MIILIIGVSGSGKGTQAELLAKKLNLPAISMGELLRQEIHHNSKLGKQVADYLKQGKWVPSRLTFRILQPTLDHHQNFILDGFPRLLDQLRLLENYLKLRHQSIDKIVYLSLSDQEAIHRLLKRARHDDTVQIIKQRLQSFHHHTRPILDYALSQGYLEEIDGDRPIAVIHQDALTRLGIK